MTCNNTATDPPISSASADQTNNDPIFGGILAVIIIINIVGIGIYCFLRRQKKKRKAPEGVNAPNGDQSHIYVNDVETDDHESNIQIQYSGPRKNSDVNSVDIKSSPKKDISKTINDDTNNHIDAETRAGTPHNTTSQSNQYSGPRKNSNDNSVDIKSNPKTSSSNHQPNSHYHVLEVEDCSAPVHTRVDDGAKQKIGKERAKKDDYDHINNGTKPNISKTIKDDTYNHIDDKMAATRDATPHNTTSQSNQYSGPRKNSNDNSVDIKSNPKTSSSNHQPNSHYHVLEGQDYSAPVHARVDDGAKQKIGKERAKKDDYDHINDETKPNISKTIKDDTYNHIDAKLAATRDATLNNTTQRDDYSHIETEDILSKAKTTLDDEPKTKQKKLHKIRGKKNYRMASYVNVNPVELSSSECDTTNTKDDDTYNHLQK